MVASARRENTTAHDDTSPHLLRGTLDVMILKALNGGPLHGYAVTRWIRQETEGLVDVEDAALYQALHRMEKKGWLESEWGRSDNNRRAKFYCLTARGRKELTIQGSSIRRYVQALLLVLATESA